MQNLLATLAFVFISVGTPGPNNIASAAMGILHGYRKTLPFLLGIVTSFFISCLLSAWAASTLLAHFPTLEAVLHYVGAAYILYLAYNILKATYSFEDKPAATPGFASGFFLQLFNPKFFVFALTLFTTFLAGQIDSPGRLLLIAFLLTCVGMLSISAWTLFGSFLKDRLRQKRIRLLVNAGLSILLVFSALDILR